MAKKDEENLAIAINAVFHGWLDRGMIKKDQIIAVATEAALLLALELNGTGHEKLAIAKAKKIFDEQYTSLDKEIDKGFLTGSSRGGYDR